MAGMDGPVDRAYLVSVEDLRDICDALNDGKREYRLTCEDEKQVAIFYNDGPDDLNAVCFTFPIVVNLNVNMLPFSGCSVNSGRSVRTDSWSACMSTRESRSGRGFILKGTSCFGTAVRIGKSSGDRWKLR